MTRPLQDMLFVRDYTGLTGGHLKFHDYMHHTQASGLVRPRLYLTPRSLTSGHLFADFEDARVPEIAAMASFFVAGDDWFLLDAAGVVTAGAPVVNLVQGFRHADPKSPLFGCLSRAALRICVSEAVADAVRPHANGEVHAIANGVDAGGMPSSRDVGRPVVVVAGWKRPELAKEVAARLRPRLDVELIAEALPRPAFLDRLAHARVGILLPLEREGFFLPPLEAMHLGCAVVTMDCIGNRYCVHENNCLLASADADHLAQAALALAFDDARRERLVAGGTRTAAEHTLERERRAYHAIVRRFLGPPA